MNFTQLEMNSQWKDMCNEIEEVVFEKYGVEEGKRRVFKAEGRCPSGWPSKLTFCFCFLRSTFTSVEISHMPQRWAHPRDRDLMDATSHGWPLQCTGTKSGVKNTLDVSRGTRFVQRERSTQRKGTRMTISPWRQAARHPSKMHRARHPSEMLRCIQPQQGIRSGTVTELNRV